MFLVRLRAGLAKFVLLGCCVESNKCKLFELSLNPGSPWYEGAGMDPPAPPHHQLGGGVAGGGAQLQAQQARRPLCRILPNLARLPGDQHRAGSYARGQTGHPARQPVTPRTPAPPHQNALEQHRCKSIYLSGIPENVLF